MLETFKRIDLSRIQEAFIKENILPARHNNGRCVMRAIIGAEWENGEIPTSKFGFDHAYLFGVMEGWDDNITNERNDIEYKLGVEDGKAAAKIMGL